MSDPVVNEPLNQNQEPLQNQAQGTENNQAPAIDENLVVNHPKYKDAIKGMNEAQREAADTKKFFEDIGFTKEQVKEAMTLFKTNPLAVRDQINQWAVQQGIESPSKPSANEPDPENFYENDPLFEKALQKRMDAYEKKFEAKFQKIEASERARSEQQFKSDATTAIKNILEKNPESGLSEQEVLDAATRNSIPPAKIKLAFVAAMEAKKDGSYDEYLETRSKKKLAEEVKNKNAGVSQTLNQPGKQAINPPKITDAKGNVDWDSIIDSGAQAIAAIKNMQ